MDLNEIKEHFISHYEFEKLESKIKLCEIKLKIENEKQIFIIKTYK